MPGINLPQHFTVAYSANVALLLQQKQSKLEGAVTIGSYTGEKASVVDQVGIVEMSQVNSRFEPKTRTDAPVDRRWVSPEDWDITQQVDTFDKLKTVTDHKSSLVQATVASINRRKDRTIIAAFTATAQTGKTGTTSTSILSGNTISVSTGGTTSGMNVAKIKAGIKLLQEHQVDEDDPIFCGLNAAANAKMLDEIQVIGAEFANSMGPVIENGRLKRLLGVNFIHTELWTSATDDLGSTSSRSLPMWAKSGMHLGMWQNQITDIRQAKELKGNPWEVYAYQSLGATRLEEKKIVRIWARE